MLYSEKLKLFTAAHTYKNMTVGGANFNYVLSGKEDGKTLVFLNGGMNTLEMWMDYVDGLADVCRILLFDYPQELRTNQELVTGMHAFFNKLGIRRKRRRYGRSDLRSEISWGDRRAGSHLNRRHGRQYSEKP